MGSLTADSAIRDWFDRYVANNRAGDFDSFADFWTEDVTWLPPDASVAQGRQAILDYARPFFQTHTIDQRFDVVEVRTVGDFAFARVSAKETYTPKEAPGEPLDLSVKSIFLFERQPDGGWLSTHCVWNTDPPSSQ